MKSKLVPALRFPEFKDCGEWEEKEFGQLCRFTRGPFGGALKKDIFVQNGYAVYEQFHAIYNNFSSFRYFINEEKFNELKRFSVDKQDLIMSCSGTMGKFAIIPSNFHTGIINQALLLLTPIKCISKFLKELLETPQSQAKILSQSGGGAIKNVVAVSEMKKILFYIPPESEKYKEQQKIADCLTSLDELINAQSEKIAELKTHKQGLMQKLFPSKGAKLPELRFSEFKDCGEWEKKALSEIASSIKKRATQGQKVLTLSSEYGIISQNEYFGRQIASENTARYIEVKKNDFIYNDRITKESKYGTIRRLTRYEIGIVSPIYKCFRFFSDEESCFWEYYFSTNLHENEYKKLANEGARGGRYNISSDKLLTSSVLTPKLAKEQQKIADCLTSLDELIEKHKNKLDLLKEHRKGLMQGLFPNCKE